MALINLQTNLKSLRYGHDRRGGGDSGQPFSYVAPNIPNIEFNYNQNLSASYAPIANVGANFFDIPEVTFNAPTFGYTSGAGVKTSIFTGKGVDIASPIIKGLDAAAGFVTNGAVGIANQSINFFNNTFDTTRTSNYPDFIWRTNRFVIGHAYQDMQRLTKFMLTPAGIFFVVKQELLERQNVKMEGTTRLYNPLGTIAQAGVNWIGYHLNKQGLNPLERSYYKGGNNGYYRNTKDSIGSSGIRNELTIEGNGPNRLTTLMLNKINRVATGFDQFGVTGVGNRTELIRYIGGPGAPLGIGSTRIGLTEPTRQVPLVENKTNFIYDNVNIDSSNYLVPLFKEGRYKVYWLYDPFDISGDTGTRSVFQQYQIRNSQFNVQILKSKYFGETDNSNNILNRNTKVISSSLYAPSTHPSASATIGRKGTDPTKPEYYTPTGTPTIKWTYKSVKSGEAYDISKKFTGNWSDSPIDEQIAKTTSEIYQNRKSAPTGIVKDKTNADKDLFTLNGSQIANKTSLGSGQNTTFGNSGITDFRSGSFKDVQGNSLITSTDYTTFNRENKYNTSQTSFKGNWIVAKNGAVVNQRITDPNEGISSDGDGGFIDSDLAAFSFIVVSPSETVDINFRAYIESWSDGFKGEWNPIKYMGRAESFYKYNGFSRDSSITFLVPTLSKLDLTKNYTKLNNLINSVLPSYSPISAAYTSGLMRGSITYVGMGDYFYLVPSIIKSIDYQEIEGMGWDIDRKEDGTRTGLKQQLPKGIKVTVNFTPVHDFTPQFGETFIGI